LRGWDNQILAYVKFKIIVKLQTQAGSNSKEHFFRRLFSTESRKANFYPGNPTLSPIKALILLINYCIIYQFSSTYILCESNNHATYVENAFEQLDLFVTTGRVDDRERAEDPGNAEQSQHCTGTAQASPVATEAVFIFCTLRQQ